MSGRVEARLRIALGALAVLLVATGCVSIPESSSVHAGRAVGTQDEQPVSRNQPSGPRPGAGRKEIATGYLNAMLAFPPAPDVVRQFLTPTASGDWNPGDGLVVYTASDQPRLSEKSDVVTLSARAVGSIDDRGSWATARGDDRTITRDFTMARVNGEWRLKNPLPGTFVDDEYYSAYFGTYSLYFFDPTKTILTADPVHLLVDDTLPTALVSDLLRGPTRSIDGAVSTSIPASASVDVAVSVSPSGVAEIPLSEDVLRLSVEDRQLLAAQLVWTLQPLDIRLLVVTVDGQRVDMGGGTEIRVPAFSAYDPAGLVAKRQLYGLTSQGLVTVTDTDATTVPGPILAPSRNARSAAVEAVANQGTTTTDATGTRGAIVSADGSTVTVAGMTVADTGAPSVWYGGGDDVVKPSWDIHGLLWFADNGPNGARLYATDGVSPDEVYARGISGQHVDSLAVSRDGVRLAAIVGAKDDRRLVVSVIARDPADGRQVTLRPAHEVFTAGATTAPLSSVAWISPTSVAALVDDDAGEPEPAEIAIDGSPTLDSRFPGFLPIKPFALAAGPNEDTPTAIADRAGAVYEQTVTTEWVQVGGSVPLRAPFYPG